MGGYNMKICMIHGSGRKGNTDITLELIKQKMSQMGDVTYTDIYLPRDLPHFCTGCMACLSTGDYAGENCPHAKYTHPILKDLLEADGIVVGCPSYALGETGQLKAFFDHFACTYIVHRPNTQMYDKTALVMSTAAGAGSGRAISTISRNLLFWGVKRIQKCKFRLFESEWQRMSQKRREKIENQISKEAAKFYHTTEKRYKLCPNLLAIIIRNVMKGAIKNYPDTQADKIYWEKKGWI